MIGTSLNLMKMHVARAKSTEDERAKDMRDLFDTCCKNESSIIDRVFEAKKLKKDAIQECSDMVAKGVVMKTTTLRTSDSLKQQIRDAKGVGTSQAVQTCVYVACLFVCFITTLSCKLLVQASSA